MPLHLRALALAAALTLPIAPLAAAPRYAWTATDPAPAATLAARIAPPQGFERVPAPPGSFADWLRGLPMKADGAPVLTYTGAKKWRQDVHVAVVDIDVGTRDLQQCADAVMRLRGEWLFASGRANDTAFNDTDGKRRRYQSSKTDHAAFRKYMNVVFAYAGTYSLDKELKPRTVGEIEAGDVFIKGGFPGHAVLVADTVVNPKTGEKRFLLLQSYMPAQEMHILKNPNSDDGSPWYKTEFGDTLQTPEWNFPKTALKTWPGR